MADEREEGEVLARQLSAEAAITRARLASDVEALGDKLAPSNLKHEAKSRLHHLVRSRGQAIVRAARQHPVPIALAVIGVGLLVWRAQRA